MEPLLQTVPFGQNLGWLWGLMARYPLSWEPLCSVHLGDWSCQHLLGPGPFPRWVLTWRLEGAWFSLPGLTVLWDRDQQEGAEGSPQLPSLPWGVSMLLDSLGQPSVINRAESSCSGELGVWVFGQMEETQWACQETRVESPLVNGTQLLRCSGTGAPGLSALSVGAWRTHRLLLRLPGACSKQGMGGEWNLMATIPLNQFPSTQYTAQSWFSRVGAAPSCLPCGIIPPAATASGHMCWSQTLEPAAGRNPLTVPAAYLSGLPRCRSLRPDMGCRLSKGSSEKASRPPSSCCRDGQ